MKIITWNCNMAFRKKAHLLMSYHPDILVIQECECLEKLIFDDTLPQPVDSLWFGNNQHKGLAILSFGDLKLRTLDVHNADLQMIVPIAVTGPKLSFTLLAVWANNPTDPDGQYVEQVWKAIHLYENLLQPVNTILIGDFNSNTIWDRKRRAGNHTNVVKFLEGKRIFSTYHVHHQQTQGKEAHPTFYLYRHQNKPYHLDYCFVSDDLAKQIKSVEIGDHKFWCKYSDHTPVIVTFGPL
jgi:exonuclease III